MLCHEVAVASQDELDAHHNGVLVRSKFVGKMVVHTGLKQSAATR